MTTTTRPLTVGQASDLGIIVRAAQQCQKVARYMSDMPGGTAEGQARSIGDQDGNFALETEDIRDCFLRVTLNSGFEAFWPVSELLEEVRAGLFVTNY